VYFSAKSWFLKYTGFLHGHKMKKILQLIYIMWASKFLQHYFFFKPNVPVLLSRMLAEVVTAFLEKSQHPVFFTLSKNWHNPPG